MRLLKAGSWTVSKWKLCGKSVVLVAAGEAGIIMSLLDFVAFQW
jgi:hypothetical protein